MECKCPPRHKQLGLPYELIDTLWNVNSERQGVTRNSYPELIDTLWNVNLIPPDLFRRGKEN